VGVYVLANIVVNPKYTQSSVLANVTQAINNIFNINNVLFNDTITISNIHNAIGSVTGVINTQLLKLVRADQDQTYTISNKALTSNVATLTTSIAHGLTVGETVLISGVDATFNGTFVVTAVTSNTFSYALIATNVSSTAAAGSITALITNDIVCFPNELPTLYELGTVASSSATGIGSVVINATGGILS
jgi:hypothetical protein